jgi:hypothetical protein
MRCDPVDPAARSTHECATTLCGCGSRRAFLQSFGAFSASSMLAAPAVWAQGASAPAAAPGKPHRIDVHHHFFPQFLLEAWQKAGVRSAPPVQSWKVEGTLEQMDRGGVATAILSLPTGLNLPDLTAEQSRHLTRVVNEYAVQAMKDHPGRFGLFAFMPMPNVDATL